MTYWIFKISDQEFYADVIGEKYVYDNTHSKRVKSDDVFTYLYTSQTNYEFLATGMVESVQSETVEDPTAIRENRVHTIFTAHLSDVSWFRPPLDISPSHKEGRANRKLLGIVDANLLGWSRSISRLTEAMYDSIIGLIEKTESIAIDTAGIAATDYSIEDSYSIAKKRILAAKFRKHVLGRHAYTCVICGTRLKTVLEVAHISPYSKDKSNRANPANGICLCSFCHRVFDRNLVAIEPSGRLLVSPEITDHMAICHFQQLDTGTRAKMLKGIDDSFLSKRLEMISF